MTDWKTRAWRDRVQSPDWEVVDTVTVEEAEAAVREAYKNGYDAGQASMKVIPK
jgi:hypothetical protein